MFIQLPHVLPSLDASSVGLGSVRMATTPAVHGIGHPIRHDASSQRNACSYFPSLNSSVVVRFAESGWRAGDLPGHAKLERNGAAAYVIGLAALASAGLGFGALPRVPLELYQAARSGQHGSRHTTNEP